MTQNNAVNNKQQASLLIANGRLHEAIPLIQQYCNLMPGDAEAFYMLGACYGSLGMYPDAVKAFNESLRILPSAWQSIFALGGALKNSGQIEEALKSFKNVISIKQDLAEAHIALADCLVILGDFSEAEAHYNKALDLKAVLAEAYLGLGEIQQKQGNHDKAVPYLRKALAKNPQLLPVLRALGTSLTYLDGKKEAKVLFKKALKINPDYVEAVGGLAVLYDLEGNHDKVFELIDPIVQKKIYNAAVGAAFSNVCKYDNRCHEAIEYLEQVLQLPYLPARSRQHIHLCIARILDRMEKYDEAFAHFKAGNDETLLTYEPPGQYLMIDKIIKVFNRSLLFGLPVTEVVSELPVFIVGMPRSGTSLTEQILASHPDVYGSGELTDIGEIIKSLPAEISTELTYPECIVDLDHKAINMLSNRYINTLKGLSKKRALRVVDKMPHNFYALGLIQILFPKARVIHCIRNPMDTCLSIYFQNFLDGHAYAKNLFNIGTHYRQYERLMQHWKNTLSISMLDVNYEDLVSAPKVVTRQMLEFCGLDWDERCLQFHKSKRVVNTASYDQVRQPLYTKSVQRWKNYEDHLDELKEGLQRGY